MVVSRLKMGEMEEVDVDHITEIPSHKVISRVMTQSRRLQRPSAHARIRLALLKSSNEIK